jgi:hypothetical protein
MKGEIKMSKKKYASLSTLQLFLDNLKDTFSALSHKHTIADITDYVVDTELSTTSINPVQNKVIDAEFDAIATAMNALDSAIDNHNHDDRYYTENEIDNMVFITTQDIDTICAGSIVMAREVAF